MIFNFIFQDHLFDKNIKIVHFFWVAIDSDTLAFKRREKPVTVLSHIKIMLFF